MAKSEVISEDKGFNVEDDVKRFEGWKVLNMLLEKAKEIDLYPARTPKNYPEGLISILFFTGLRIREVIPNKRPKKGEKAEDKEFFKYGLKREHFNLSDSDLYVVVNEVPILKKWLFMCLDCGKEWKTRPGDDKREKHNITTKRKTPEKQNRTFRISKEIRPRTDVFEGRTERDRLRAREVYEEENSPYYSSLMQTMINFIEDSEGFLFEGLSYQQAWRLCRLKIGSIVDFKTSPHWFRAQRASQLAVEQDASERELLSHFNWDKKTTAKHYVNINRPPNMKSGRVIG